MQNNMEKQSKGISELVNERIQQRIKKLLNKKELALVQRYEQETDEEKKKRLRFKLVEKIGSKILKAVIEEIGQMRDKEFNAYCEERFKPILEKLTDVGKEYLQLEVLLRDPLTVFAEVRDYEGLIKKARNIMDVRIRKVPKLKLLQRVVVLLNIDNFAYRVFLAAYRPFFEIANLASTRLQLDENWIIANGALDLEENLLKKKCIELRATKKELSGVKYEDLVTKAISLIQEGENRRVPIEIFTTSGYRRIRNLLKHEAHAYRPSRKETLEIVGHVMKLSSALWQ